MDEYVVCGFIGKGNQGQVYLIKDKSDQQYYATKIIQKQHINYKNFYNKISNERELLLKMDHPFISKTYKAFQNEENLILKMELGKSGSL